MLPKVSTVSSFISNSPSVKLLPVPLPISVSTEAMPVPPLCGVRTPSSEQLNSKKVVARKISSFGMLVLFIMFMPMLSLFYRCFCSFTGCPIGTVNP